MFYNREGESISLEEWVQLFELPGYNRVARTVLADGRVVSTVWIGLFSFKGIFETMVFDSTGEPIMRFEYTTEPKALRGHRKIVARLQVEKV